MSSVVGILYTYIWSLALMFSLKYNVFICEAVGLMMRNSPFQCRCSIQIHPSFVGVGLCHDVSNIDMWLNLELYIKDVFSSKVFLETSIGMSHYWPRFWCSPHVSRMLDYTQWSREPYKKVACIFKMAIGNYMPPACQAKLFYIAARLFLA